MKNFNYTLYYGLNEKEALKEMVEEIIEKIAEGLEDGEELTENDIDLDVDDESIRYDLEVEHFEDMVNIELTSWNYTIGSVICRPGYYKEVDDFGYIREIDGDEILEAGKESVFYLAVEIPKVEVDEYEAEEFELDEEVYDLCSLAGALKYEIKEALERGSWRGITGEGLVWALTTEYGVICDRDALVIELDDRCTISRLVDDIDILAEQLECEYFNGSARYTEYCI